MHRDAERVGCLFARHRRGSIGHRSPVVTAVHRSECAKQQAPCQGELLRERAVPRLPAAGRTGPEAQRGRAASARDAPSVEGCGPGDPRRESASRRGALQTQASARPRAPLRPGRAAALATRAAALKPAFRPRPNVPVSPSPCSRVCRRRHVRGASGKAGKALDEGLGRIACHRRPVGEGQLEARFEIRVLASRNCGSMRDVRAWTAGFENRSDAHRPPPYHLLGPWRPEPTV